MRLALLCSRTSFIKLIANLSEFDRWYLAPFLPPSFERLCSHEIRRCCTSTSIRRPTVRVSVPDRGQPHFFDIARSTQLMSELIRRGKIVDARAVFENMPEKDVLAWTTLITGDIKFGMIREARLLFDQPAAKKNVVTWTSLIAGYFRLKRVSEAEELFRKMPEKNIVSWNTMISGYAENGRVVDAYRLFKEMPERSTVSWNTIVTALAQVGQIDKACSLFERMPEKDVISWTAMVAGLAQNGRIGEAQELFDRMPERNVISWNAMITGYAQNMRYKKL